MDNSQLRSRFNPDGSMLRRHQMRMLDILIEIDGICRRHQIPYWLSSGTLIGAVRHGGFIPWDDDLDIEMLRPDYLRLMKVLSTELPEWLALQEISTDSNYYFFYAKIRDRKSRISETNGYDRVFRDQGIYIDIFPLETQPLWVHRLSETAQGHVYKIMNRKGESDRSKMRKVRMFTRFNSCITYPLLRMISFLPGRFLTSGLGIPYHNRRQKEEIFPLTEMAFEDHMFFVPNDTDSYLRRLYGDYMQLPNLEELHPHLSEIEFLNQPE